MRINARMSVHPTPVALGLVAVALAALLGCGSQSPTGGTSGGSPSPQTPTVGGPSATTPCGRPVTDRAVTRQKSAAALLQATVTVTGEPAPTPACTPLTVDARVRLRPGDRVEFIANGTPTLSGDVNAVVESERPGPSPPLTGLPTTHVVVTLTAAASGTVSVRWINCSGTAC